MPDSASSEHSRLYVFAGLLGVGKTTLARRLAGERKAAYLRIDTIEQALRDLCGVCVATEGYSTSYRIAADNLAVGTNVIADSVNPIEQTRQAWTDVADRASATAVHIEVVCSDADEHRRRIETRSAKKPDLTLPAWSDVERREYDETWTRPRIVVDTAGATVAESFSQFACSTGPTSVSARRLT